MVRKENIAYLLLPNQLFRDCSVFEGKKVYFIEEYLFFRQFKFHKQKIAFHRASMLAYFQFLQENGIEVEYISSQSEFSDVRSFSKVIRKDRIDKLLFFDPCDDWLNRRINKLANYCSIERLESPLFINSSADLEQFFREDKKSFFQTTFYKQQRKKLGILMDENGQPTGGQWTYDADNRKKYPKGKTSPIVQFPVKTDFWEQAIEYVEREFESNPGEIKKEPFYPINFEQSDDWLKKFLETRFLEFGPYEDAIVKEDIILHHSLISPLMNVGLLEPLDVVKKIEYFSKNNQIPINSVEGLIRQIIGWREFIRGMYISKGGYSRKRNFWGFKRKLPSSFYDGSTGVLPIDDTIKKILQCGYCHHIERLMVLGNFMLLCQFDPDDVYQWFMELFIDSYDWVMVPNVYGMALFADGGLFATKPYIGGSNYIKKMSNYPKGDWEEIWDGLFWSFVDEQKDFFLANPRTSMIVRNLNRMSKEKFSRHKRLASQFLSGLK